MMVVSKDGGHAGDYERNWLEGYDFPFSWARLLPSKKFSPILWQRTINQKGVEYYNNLIDELVKHGNQIWLQDEYGGWLSPKIIDDFLAYANICFQEFGDRISHWTTLNEPNIFTLARMTGDTTPNRCSYPFGSGSVRLEILQWNRTLPCTTFLAHASVVELYRTKYQPLVPDSLPIDSAGLESFLLCLKSKYGNLPIYIHENGYFVWSFLDDENRRRQSKLSALWYREFLKKIQDVMAF
ncbi:unnamed protein product [Spirodela intermedia]|uniref:Uncharacterized protein n=1 Tax=Spirodela intermedia TaxID=51605 RepID=A0A7I8J078_SPIIN|nr:unnamed protein product [Spirodela intermedia]CAA6663449.1 unnamed protein product [Spirodela intermedia]